MEERFARHALIPGWNQKVLAETRLVIVGMGALGNEVSRQLALAGVGQLLLCDPDTVSRSNLSRCPLFNEADLGRLKVEAAAASLIRLNPKLQLTLRAEPHAHGIGLAELRDASLVFSCLDSHAARLQLNGRCRLVGAPLLDGGTHAWGGEVRPFLDQDGPCYSCTLGSEQRASGEQPWSCTDATEDAVAPVAASSLSTTLVGGWMATLGLRHLFGLKLPPGPLKIDIPSGTTQPVIFSRDPACPYHQPMVSARLLPISANHSIADLRAHLGPQGRILTWLPFCTGRICFACGKEQPLWTRKAEPSCSACGQRALIRTSCELDQAPAATILAELGIAPREILIHDDHDQLNPIELAHS